MSARLPFPLDWMMAARTIQATNPVSSATCPGRPGHPTMMSAPHTNVLTPSRFSQCSQSSRFYQFSQSVTTAYLVQGVGNHLANEVVVTGRDGSNVLGGHRRRQERQPNDSNEWDTTPSTCSDSALSTLLPPLVPAHQALHPTC